MSVDKIEGSICAVYVHKETSYFLGHYFIDRVLVPTTTRNEVYVDSERDPLTLSVFNLPGRHSGKAMEHWMVDPKEYRSAHVHVLINCAEVKPYLE